MDFIGFLRNRPSISAEQRDNALSRRASWQYPEGITVIAEYWPMSAEYQVVTIFSAATFAPVLELVFEWNDVFDLSIFPAVSAEEGLKIGPDVFARLPRLQQR